MPAIFENDDSPVPNKFNFPDKLMIDFMIDDMADGKPEKYEYIENNFDIDDYYLWLTWRTRKSAIEKWYINKSNKNA